MLQQNKLLVDFLVIIHTAPVFRSVGPGSSLAGYTIALCLHSRDFCPLAPLYLRCVTGYLRHIMSRGEWSASAYRNWDERRVGALLWFPLYWIRYGDSKRWQGIKQDFRPNWYQSLHNPPSPWKIVPHHKGLRPLLFKNSSVGYFMSHKNRLKTGIHFSHSALELGMVFEGTTGVYERTRKSNIRIRSVF